MKAAAVIRASMTESQFQDAIIDLAHVHHWIVTHPRPAQTSRGWRTAIQGDAGAPDLTLARSRPGKSGYKIAFVELKSSHGRVRPEQQVWMEILQCAAIDCPFVYVGLWRPDMWAEIERVLS